MKSTKCNQCGLVNFATAEFCQRCQQQMQNHSSTSDNQSNPKFIYLNKSSQQSAPQYSPTQYSPTPTTPDFKDNSKHIKNMLVGALLAVGGTIATAIGYSSAKGGGRYAIFWGAILFGTIDFIVGLSGLISNKD